MATIDLFVKKRILHGVELWWICRKIAHRTYQPYSDIYAPTGYGFKSKARAEQKAREIEQRLAAEA